MTENPFKPKTKSEVSKVSPQATENNSDGGNIEKRTSNKSVSNFVSDGGEPWGGRGDPGGATVMPNRRRKIGDWMSR